jgi:hypothetical protein
MGIRLLLPVTALCFAHPAAALQKTAARMPETDRTDQWNAATTCTLAYYNTCTGWIWLWHFFECDVIGVCYTSPFESATGLLTTSVLTYSWVPPGWAYTGTIDVWETDPDCCTMSHLSGQPFDFSGGWARNEWNGLIVPNRFLITVTLGPNSAYPPNFASDHPMVGPTGPQACGHCYPTNRKSQSYYFGNSHSPKCPPLTLSDGICCVEWIWDARVCGPFGLEESSWSGIKLLYR